MRCSLCQMDPGLKQAWGCEAPCEGPVWEHDGDLYFSCPVLWITTDVADWYRQYAYAKEFGGARYEDQSQPWLEAYEEYTRAYQGFLNERSEKQAAMMNSVTRFKHAQGEEIDG